MSTLSLIVHRCSKAELLTKFPEITKHQIDKARRHAFVYGPGSDVQLKASSQHRERINYAKLQHAVEFSVTHHSTRFHHTLQGT